MASASNNSNIQLSIVLPCYNPPTAWVENVILNYNKIADSLKMNPELIIVNDGSTINVHARDFEKLAAAIPNFKSVTYQENKGKGFALREGVKVVSTPLIIYTDIDFPYEVSSFVSVFETLKKDVDIAPGHRGTNYYNNTPFLRKLISKTLRKFLKTFLRLPTDDSQCGIKGFNQKGAHVFLDTRINRFLFDLEFLKLASKRKLKVENVSVVLRPNIVFSKVSLKILLRESLNFFKVLIRK